VADGGGEAVSNASEAFAANALGLEDAVRRIARSAGLTQEHHDAICSADAQYADQIETAARFLESAVDLAVRRAAEVVR